jgi:hypothetical protein
MSSPVLQVLLISAIPVGAAFLSAAAPTAADARSKPMAVQEPSPKRSLKSETISRIALASSGPSVSS